MYSKEHEVAMEEYMRRHFTTQKEILDHIKKTHKLIMENSKKDLLHSAAFYNTLDVLFKKFIEKVENTILFEKLEAGWRYDFAINYSGAGLYVIHAEVYEMDGDEVIYEDDQTFQLIDISTKLLSVEEYADIYGVGTGTVRQWIRRGKIRNAVKQGSEWKIPELTDPPRRGYLSAFYRWDDILEGLPEEFNFLKVYSSVCISQCVDDKSCYQISFWKTEDAIPAKEIFYSIKEKEKFEIFLISHPQIYYVPNYGEGIMVDIVNVYKNY